MRAKINRRTHRHRKEGAADSGQHAASGTQNVITMKCAIVWDDVFTWSPTLHHTTRHRTTRTTPFFSWHQESLQETNQLPREFVWRQHARAVWAHFRRLSIACCAFQFSSTWEGPVIACADRRFNSQAEETPDDNVMLVQTSSLESWYYSSIVTGMRCTVVRTLVPGTFPFFLSCLFFFSIRRQLMYTSLSRGYRTDRQQHAW